MDSQTIIALIGILGGWELIKYLLNLSQNKRIVHTQATEAEFKILKDIIEFLEDQWKKKEERFVEQTELVRKLNRDLCDTWGKDVEQEKEIGCLKIQIEYYKNVLQHHGLLDKLEKAEVATYSEEKE